MWEIVAEIVQKVLRVDLLVSYVSFSELFLVVRTLVMVAVAAAVVVPVEFPEEIFQTIIVKLMILVKIVLFVTEGNLKVTLALEIVLMHVIEISV